MKFFIDFWTNVSFCLVASNVWYTYWLTDDSDFICDDKILVKISYLDRSILKCHYRRHSIYDPLRIYHYVLPKYLIIKVLDSSNLMEELDSLRNLRRWKVRVISSNKTEQLEWVVQLFSLRFSAFHWGEKNLCLKVKCTCIWTFLTVKYILSIHYIGRYEDLSLHL